MQEDEHSIEQDREHKLFGKHKWRGKFISSEEKNIKNQGKLDDAVSHFLQGNIDGMGTQQQHDMPVPRIDTSNASRWPSATEVSKVGIGNPPYPRRKPPRRKGLRVNFVSAGPEIIGEGGDEAELPSIEVSRSWAPSKSRQQSQGELVGQATKSNQPLVAPDQSARPTLPYVSFESDSFRPQSLQRRPTGIANAPMIDDLHINGRVIEPVGSVPSTPYEARDNRLPQLQLEAEGEELATSEGRMTSMDRDAFYKHTPTPPIGQSGQISSSSNRSASSFPRPPSPDPTSRTVNALTPLPSPQPHVEPSLSTYSFPSVKTRGTTLADVEGPEIPDHKTACSPEKPIKSASEGRPSLKNIVKSLGGEALDDFNIRVQRFYKLFELGTDPHGSLSKIEIAQWTRMSTWWFLKGRQELESAVRSKSRGVAHHIVDKDPSRELKQAHLDLAKAWWITREVIPAHPELRKYGRGSMSTLLAVVESFGNSSLAELIETHLAVVTHMRALTISMKRNEKLPPQDFEIQGLDSRVWIQYAGLSSTTVALLSSRYTRSLVSDRPDDPATYSSTPVGDTHRYFVYGNMFVDVLLGSQNHVDEEVNLPCVLTILRERTGWDLKLMLASQNGQLNQIIQSDRKAGLTWDDVQWKTKLHTLQISLSSGFILEVHLSEQDFISLWGIHNYTQKVQDGFRCRKTEKNVFEGVVPSFQYIDPKNSKSFPPERIKGCNVRLFEKHLVSIEGTGQRRVHDGHRLTMVTPPSIKTLSSIGHEFGKQTPILFSYLRSEDGAPASLLRTSSASASPSMVISFHDAAERGRFHSFLDGTSITIHEHCSTCLPLRALTINIRPIGGESSFTNDSLMNGLHWQQVRIIFEAGTDSDPGGFSTVRSENLRIWADCDLGTFVDRINLGPGELQLNLDVDSLTSLSVLRPPQGDMTCSFANNLLAQEKDDELDHTLQVMKTSTTVRCYDFLSLSDLHTFQSLITGFSITYDGLATNFAISRRRMVVPIYKRWEASSTRLQVIKQDKTIQLVVFFKNFSHGHCMNFVLKSTDVFESFSRSGNFYLRITDAKFALPKGDEDASREFISLDTPEYPSEHDDVTIEFGTEAERDSFGSALPAAISKFSRMGSLRR